VARREAPSRVSGYAADTRGPDPTIVKGARRLRRTAPDAENEAWFALQDRRLAGFKFVRQEPIPPFVADFVCRDQKLVIEVDGGQHADNAKDVRRDAFLRADGYRVLRFWNTDVLSNLDGVLTTILTALESNKPDRA
jgi:very-short-patch-repair endonuclease